MNYSETLVFLDNLQMHKIKLGLAAMHSFLAKIGGPEKRLKIIHVAGTNGKGSVCATLLTILQRSGRRVGLYTSPHLSCVRERFRINDRYITQEEFAGLASRIVAALGDETITYFEFTTALALLWFAEADLDLVILETGLGGRLDATNVVTPLVSVITSISMDHEAYLGTTIKAVAGEKAGIIKAGVPVVATGGTPEIVAVLTSAAAEQQAPLYLLGRDFTIAGDSNDDWAWLGNEHALPGMPAALGGRIGQLRCAMKGAYQRENAALAIATLRVLRQYGIDINEDIIRIGLMNVHWPGRLEYLELSRESLPDPANLPPGDGGPIRLLLDGAHNPDGLAKLATTLRQEYVYDGLILVWGAMLDKDIRGGLAALAPLARTLILTRPDGERSAEPEQLLAYLPADVRHRAVLRRDPRQAVLEAASLASDKDLIVVAGSLYLVGAVRSFLVGGLVGDD